ncbi:MAG: hypothetical protein OXE40_10205, partial [Gammaproteobacteria bacterium]|nr:hypothetical protein [Gammaproteobacteria bacterium]
AGSMVVAVTDAPGTSSGARAAGAVRGRGTLPAPEPTESYKSPWRNFVAWCKARNEQPWPASPELVANYLKDCAAQYGHATLRKIRSAISQTHHSANLDNPCTTGLVKTTIAELSRAKGWNRAHSTRFSGHLLGTVEFEMIRAAALEPRPRGQNVEHPDNARSRGLVDLALCSLVLEAGLRCDQAAALEWGDLGLDTHRRPAIRVRKRSSEAGVLIGISARAFDDLEAIAPESAAANPKIFEIGALQIAARIRASAQVAGLESRITGEAIRLDPPAAPTRASRWRTFCAWCDASALEKLPARAETVAEYLREGSGFANLTSVYANMDAIANAHREAGINDPCATDLIRATIGEIRRLRSRITPTSLDAGALQAIRATALQPRQHHRGWEAGPTARRRGLVDLALCSVLQATKLTVEKAVALNWGDVEKLDEGKVRLTVRSKADPHGGPEVCELSGAAVRDLEAIRRGVRPEGSVFGLSQGQAYVRVRQAVKAAGLDALPTAGPSQTATPGPSHAATAGPPRTPE